MAVPRTAPAAQAEPGERGDAGQGPPGRGHRDSNPAPALVAVRKGIKLRGNIIGAMVAGSYAGHGRAS